MQRKNTCTRLCALLMALTLLSGCQSTHDGWLERDDGRYYYRNGSALCGWQVLEDTCYYFLDDGAMATGWQQIDGQMYYFDDSGHMAVGWKTLNGKLYYFRENGSRVTGWLSLENVRYYLHTDGTAASGPTQIDGTMYLFDAHGILSSGWVNIGDTRYYGDQNYHPLCGWQEIEGIGYFFEESYAQQTGWLEKGGFSFYFFEDGSPAHGMCTIDGVKQYFAFNGQQVVLVNPWNYVPEGYSVTLESIGSTHQIAAYAVADFEEMMAACRMADLTPVVCSSYRSHEYQQQLYERRIARYVADGYTQEEATAKAGTSVAIPGTSEHQLGLALDIIDNANWNLDESQATMPTQQWLMEHSWEYGWILRYPNDKSAITGIIYEPWHYRYVGRTVAADIYSSGLCLEEYLQLLTPGVG